MHRQSLTALIPRANLEKTTKRRYVNELNTSLQSLRHKWRSTKCGDFLYVSGNPVYDTQDPQCSRGSPQLGQLLLAMRPSVSSLRNQLCLGPWLEQSDFCAPVSVGYAPTPSAHEVWKGALGADSNSFSQLEAGTVKALIFVSWFLAFWQPPLPLWPEDLREDVLTFLDGPFWKM